MSPLARPSPKSQVPRLLGVLILLCAPTLASQSFDCDGHFNQLVVPAGMCVRVFADSVGPVRHVIVHPSGQVVAALNQSPGIIRLRDKNGDGRADESFRFGPHEGGTGLAWRAGWLYFAANSGVVRYRWPAGAESPDTIGEWIARDLPTGNPESAHAMKGIAIGPDGMVYVSIGSSSDNCAIQDRGAYSPGRWPCPELVNRAGIWRYAPPDSQGKPWIATRFATGLRNAEAMAMDANSGRLWAAVNGRDYLNREWGWPDSLSANQPAEILVQVNENGDYGWPYCQGNWTRHETLLIKAPEYSTHADLDCAAKNQPAMGFPAHWAPIAVAVVNSAVAAVPHPGLFIAFHGSRSRTPLAEDGHYLLFVSLDENGKPAGDYRIILRSTAGPGAIRPSGVAVSISGGIYVSDDDHRRIYLIEPHPPKSP